MTVTCLMRQSMTVGSKSLLFGVHQFIWHPITVLLAWRYLYKSWPNWKELICIFIHDWGYWGCDTIDGTVGEQHPYFAARLVSRLGPEYAEMVLLHSRHLAAKLEREPSKLCWADKYSIHYDPWWFYLFRAKLSGELKEYRTRASGKYVGKDRTDREWYDWLRDKLTRKVLEALHEMP